MMEYDDDSAADRGKEQAVRAMVLPSFGGPELFEERQVERPEPGPNQVLVRVIASGTNPVDAKIRANGTWMGIKPPAILGYDAAGVVEAVGPGVNDFEPGDAVYYAPVIYGNQSGSYAEYNVAAEAIVARKQRNLSFVEAAAIPVAGGTAWEAVIRRLKVRPGETVLIQGGAGGVGSFAVQFAKDAGARVLSTASGEHLDRLRELGVDVAIDYRTEDVLARVRDETDGQGVDAVFDIAGENLVSRSLPVIKPFGRVACILPPQGDLTPLHAKNITLYGVFLIRERGRLDEMRPVFERGHAKPVIDEVLPLDQVSRAHQRLETGHIGGKIVLQVAAS